MSVQTFTELLTTRKFLLHLAAFVTILTVATLFYVLVEGRQPLDAFYFVVTTITLIGSNYNPTTPAGTIFASLLAFASVGIIISLIAQVFGPHFAVQILSQRRTHRVSEMEGHTIVAGDSPTSRELLRSFDKKNTLVLVEGEEAFTALSTMGYSAIRGDPASGRLLEEAGIQKCRSIIAASDSDADNAFVCLTAKKMRKDVRVIAKISAEESREKLAAAGADFIVCPPTLALNEITRAAFS